MVKILVYNTAATSGGALSLLIDFYNFIKTYDTENQYTFLLSGAFLENTENITIKVLPKLKRYIQRLEFELLTGAKYINHQFDILFSMQNTTIRKVSIPQVLYLHQSIPFQKTKKFNLFIKEERYLFFVQFLLGAYIKASLGKSHKVIVQSNWLKKEIASFINIEKIKVIPPNVSVETIQLVKSEEFKNNVFFYPTTFLIYKNNQLIEEACNILDRRYPELEYEVQLTTDVHFGNKHIRSIGTISRKHVYDMLSSSVLLFPSYIESFGLPLGEGRSINTIILASNTPFSHEILNGYNNAYFFDPFNPAELANLMYDSIQGKIAVKENVDYLTGRNNSWKDVLDLLIKGG